MTSVLRVIPILSTGGAARALIATAKFSSRQGPFLHRVISLRPGESEAIELARDAGLTVLNSPDRTTIVQEIAAADIVHVDWWNDPHLQSLLHDELPPLRLLLWYHVAGNSAPQVITRELVDLADLNVPTNPWSYGELPVFRDMPLADREGHVAMVIDGADFERLEGVEPKPHPHFNVGYIGTLDFVKLHRRFIPMSAAISIPDVRFVVCGHEAGTRLAEEAGELGAAERFDFRGYVSDIRPVIEILDVYGYPLCDDTYASGELNLQEVMYAGVTPVVFPYGGVRGLVKNNETGLVVAGEDEYKQAIEFLYHHPEERRRLGLAARDYAREYFGAENAARILNPLYERLMRAPKRQRIWGCQPDRQLPERYVSSLGKVDKLDGATGAWLFVESLGNEGSDFLTSLTSQDVPALLASENAIARASLRLRSAGAGGILNYRNAFPDDRFLRLWSGLVLRQERRFAEAISDLTTAISLGCDHWRVTWYVDQAQQAADEDHASAARSEELLADMRVIAESNRGWAENAEKMLVDTRVTAETNRVWAENTEKMLADTRVIAEANRVWAENTEKMLTDTREVAESNRMWAEDTERMLTQVRAQSSELFARLAEQHGELERLTAELASLGVASAESQRLLGARDREIDELKGALKPLRAFANRLNWLYRLLERFGN